MGAAVGEQEDGLPSQIAYQNPMSLVVHDRKNIDEMDDSMGSLAQELLNTTPGMMLEVITEVISVDIVGSRVYHCAQIYNLLLMKFSHFCLPELWSGIMK